MAAGHKLPADSKTRSSAVRNHRNTLTLLITCTAIFLDSLDTSTVGVALPSIRRDLGIDESSLQWLISGYTIAYGGFLLLGGRVADMFGRRKIFMLAITVFIVASIVGGAVSSGPLIIATRVVKGLAAAFTAPAAFSIITTTFEEGPRRNKALAIYTATAATGYSIGLVASGMLTQVHWRLVFFLPGAAALIALILTPAAVDRDSPARGGSRSYDPGGAVTATSAILLLVYALVQGPVIGWTAASTIISLALVVVLLAAFFVIERRHPEPTVPLRIFRSRTRSSSYLIAVALGAAAIGWQFVATLYMQRILGYSALRTALAMLPLGVMVFVTAQFVTGRLLGRVGIRAVCVSGMLLQVLALMLFSYVGLVGHYDGIMLPGLVIHGLALGLVFPSINVGGVSGVADERQGVAAGLIVAAYAIGSGLGTAIMAAIVAAATSATSPVSASPAGGAQALLNGYQSAFVGGALMATAGLVVAIVALPRKRALAEARQAAA
ncbi:MAG TPA: MFS transporter [Streptosporangiaceae bacterium]|jgi:MFS family permease|nr:MFS transporter [Streptosporangiaceae bacterium]